MAEAIEFMGCEPKNGPGLKTLLKVNVAMAHCGKRFGNNFTPSKTAKVKSWSRRCDVECEAMHY